MKRSLSMRVLTLLLALVMVVGYVPASVLATETDDVLATSEPTVPETTAPETTAPETTAPETTVPETTVPETTVPETTVPETTVPKTTVPEETKVEKTTVKKTAVKSGSFVSQTHDTFSTTKSTIAPGVTQSVNYAYAKDGKQMVYYVLTADINRDDVVVQTSYKDQYVDKKFDMEKLTAQMAFADKLYTDETSDRFISEHYKVVGGVNASFYNMTTGQPSGVTYLDGVQIGESASYAQFFAVLKDGTAVIDYTKNLKNYEGNIWQACAGSQMLVFNGKDVTANATGSYNTDRHSRTCVGITADGKVVMMSLDGRQEPFSCGGTMHELAQIMLEQGCVAAINLDGGGSTTFAARQEGENEVSIVNRPSDGSERSISSGLIIGSLAAPSDVFDRATLTAEQAYVTPGSSVNITAKGVSPAGTAAEIPAEATWQIKDAAMGTIVDGVFTSSGVAGDAVVQMMYNGSVVGETTIHVVVPEKIAFNSAIITVPYGKSIQLGLTATYGLNVVTLKPADLKFTLEDAAMGVIDGFGFTACAEESGLTGGKITVALTAYETVSGTAELIFGKGSEVIEDFEDNDLGNMYIKTGYPQYGPKGSAKDANGNYYYNGQNELGKVYIVNEANGQVHDGEYALAVECDYSQAYETGYHMLSLQGFELKVPANAQTIGMWIYLPELEELSTTSMRICGTTEGGTVGDVTSPWLWDNCAPYGWDNDGWQYLTMDISGYNKAITFSYIQLYICDRDNTDVGFKFTESASVNGKFTYYFDNITVDYSSAVDDREAPVFSSVVYADEFTNDAPELKGQTTTSNVLSFTATVADYVADNATGVNAAAVKAYIDGVAVAHTYAGGKIAITDAVLADGAHTIRFEASDNMGNMSYVERQITVNAKSDIPTVSVVPQKPDADKLLIGSLYWVDLVATDAQKISTVEATFNLNSVSQWELDNMVVTPGFEATYTLDEVSNNATIKITKNGEVAEGTTVLAQLPIRTWESRLTQYKGYEDQTPQKLWSRKIIWPMDIKLSVDYGAIAFEDGTTGSFSMAPIAVLTELYGNYGELNANGDYANKTSWHIHTAEAMEDKAVTCTEDGYTGRTFCKVCDSIVAWGTKQTATDHVYELVDGVLKCSCGELFNGDHTDGKTYVDGVIANGWVSESYYVDGTKLTGIQKVEGFYYDFGEDGVCAGKTKYTGLFSDGTNTYYALFGELVTGWRMLPDGWYYFDKTTGAGLVGDHTIDVNGVNVPYTFEATGKLASDVWYTNTKNQMYRYYGPGYYTRVWKEIDGEKYFLNWVGVAARGVYGVQDSPHMPEIFYLFDLDTCALIDVVDGFMTYGGNTYYYHTRGVNAPAYGFRCIDGRYYYFSTSTGAMRTGDYTVMSYNSNGLLTENRTFHFDETHGYAVDKDGNPLTSLETQEPDAGYPKFVKKDGKTYYYRNASGLAFGFWKIGNYYYYFSTSNGAMRTGDYTVQHYSSNGLLTEARTFHFDETHGYAVDKDGNPLTTLELQEPVEAYPKFVEKDGKTYYYRSANAIAFGFWKIDGHYYYFSTSSGAMRTGDYTVVSYTSNGLLTANRTFHFDETHGYAVDENGNPLTTLETQKPEPAYPKFVEKNGKTYYYRNANALAFGFWEIDGHYYYFSTSSGEMRTGDYKVMSYASNGLLDKHTTFHFDEVHGYAVDANGDPITSLS